MPASAPHNDDLDDDLPGDEAKVETPKPEPKKPATAASPTPPAAPIKHQHSAYLVSTARKLGFTQSDLDNYPSNEIWEAIHQTEAQAKPAPKSAPVEKPVEDEEYDWNSEEVAGVPGLKSHLQKQAKELKELKAKTAKIDEFEKAEVSRTNRRNEEVIDDAFAALGERFESIVGKGDMTSLADDGAKRRRVAIYGSAAINLQQDTSRTIARKIAEAALLLYPAVAKPEVEDVGAGAYAGGPPVKKVPPKDPATGRFTADDFEKGKLQRPSAKRPHATEISGIEVLRNHFKENGDPRGDRAWVDPDDTDDLPG